MAWKKAVISLHVFGVFSVTQWLKKTMHTVNIFAVEKKNRQKQNCLTIERTDHIHGNYENTFFKIYSFRSCIFLLLELVFGFVFWYQQKSKCLIKCWSRPVPSQNAFCEALSHHKLYVVKICAFTKCSFQENVLEKFKS